MSDTRKYLRAAEAATYLGVARQTLARWRSEGVSLPFSKAGRAVVYSVADLDAYLLSTRRCAPETHAPSTSRAA